MSRDERQRRIIVDFRKNRRLLCFSSEFDCRKKGKKEKGKRKKSGGGGETRITKNNWRFDRKKYGQDAKQRVREMASSSLENSIFQDFSVIGRL